MCDRQLSRSAAKSESTHPHGIGQILGPLINDSLVVGRNGLEGNGGRGELRPYVPYQGSART